MGLGIPACAQLANRLREKGFEIPRACSPWKNWPAIAACPGAKGRIAMLKNITLGQYFPGDSVVHRLIRAPRSG